MITLPGVDPRMIANNLEPFEPVHPGELLKEEIEYRGIPQKRLAAQMGISRRVLKEMLNCKRPVTAEHALLFEAALGIKSGIFMRMQTDYDVQVLKRNKSFVEHLENVRRLAAS
jgi:addiction module HigA family antidote